jgi:hypothetical protein
MTLAKAIVGRGRERRDSRGVEKIAVDGLPDAENR